MMTNKKQVKTAFALFNQGDLQAASKLCKRIENNFSIDDDEIGFTIEAKIYQPYAKSAENLPPELIWDNISDRESFDINQYDIKIAITATLKEKSVIKGDSEWDIKDTYFTRFIRWRLDEDGEIASGVGNMKAGKKQIKNWLKQEFGKVEQW